MEKTMKKIIYSAATAALLLASGCSNEELVGEQPVNSEEFVIEVGMGVDSRTYNGENGVCYFGSGEIVYATSADGKVHGKLRVDGQVGNKVTLRGYIFGGDPSNLHTLFYPAPNDEGIIPMGEIGGCNHNAPMSAVIGGGNDGGTNFNYAGGLVRMVLEGADEATISGSTQTGTSGVTGGHYTFNRETGKMEFQEGTSSDVTVKDIPENGVIYLPVATDDDDSTKETVTLEVRSVTVGDETDDNPNVTIEVEVNKGASTQNNVPEVGVDINESGEIETTKYGVVKGGEDLAEAVSNSENVKLNAHFELTEPLVITDETTIDLAGFSIKDNAEGFEGDALIIVDRGGSLTIKDSSDGMGEIWAKTISVAIKMTRDNATDERASLTVDGGNIRALDIAVSGNGKRHGTDITINGGKFHTTEEESVAIYHPQDGTLTINGGEFGAHWAAIEMRAGTLTINDGSFNAAYSPTSGEQDGSGSTIHGAAIAVSQHSTHKPIVIDIKNGEFHGHSAFHEEYFEDVNKGYTGFKSEGCSLNIEGGRFIGEIYSENFTDFIEGGAFTDLASAVHYAKDNVEIALAEPAEGRGIKINKNITIDLQGHAYKVVAPTVGSPGTETLAFQILYGTDKANPVDVTIKNGIIHSGVAKFLIQNYADLTLTDVTLDLYTSHKQSDGSFDTQAYYALSCNNGNVTLNGKTRVTVQREPELYNGQIGKYFAFDVCDYSSYEGVKVTVNTTDCIQGDIEVTNPNGNDAKTGLNVISGEISGRLVTTLTSFAEGYGITIGENAVVKDESWASYITKTGN